MATIGSRSATPSMRLNRASGRPPSASLRRVASARADDSIQLFIAAGSPNLSESVCPRIISGLVIGLIESATSPISWLASGSSAVVPSANIE